MDRVQDRTGLAGRPHGEAVDAQIADTQAQAARLGTVAARECRKSRRARAREQIGQRGVLLAVRYRVQAEYSCLRHRIDRGRVQTQPSLAGGVGGIDCHALEPRLHLRPGGRANQYIAERRRVAFQDGAFAARVPDRDLRPILRGATRLSWQHHLCAQLIQIKDDDLTKARSPAIIKHDIAADLELQAVQRSLRREPVN